MTDMNPNTPNQPQNFDPTRRLKKVKRPIKRYIGQPNPSAPQAPGMQMHGSAGRLFKQSGTQRL